MAWLGSDQIGLDPLALNSRLQLYPCRTAGLRVGEATENSRPCPRGAQSLEDRGRNHRVPPGGGGGGGGWLIREMKPIPRRQAGGGGLRLGSLGGFKRAKVKGTDMVQKGFTGEMQRMPKAH